MEIKTTILTMETEPIADQEKTENGIQKMMKNGTMEKISSQERKMIS